MEKQQILLMGLGTQETLVRQALAETEIQILSADSRDMERTIGQVFSAQPSPGPGEAMDLTLIMFRGFTREALDPVLKAIREAGLSRQPLKAMVTATNWGWTLGALYEELQQEQEIMAALMRLKKLRDSISMPDILDIQGMRTWLQAEKLFHGGEDVTLEAIRETYQALEKMKK